MKARIRRLEVAARITAPDDALAPQMVLRLPWNGDQSGPPRLRAPYPTTGPYLQLFDPETSEDLTAEGELALDEQAVLEGRGGTE